MKNKKIVERLLELRDTHIDMIDAKEGLNHTCGLASNYVELIHSIADLLKTSTFIKKMTNLCHWQDYGVNGQFQETGRSSTFFSF